MTQQSDEIRWYDAAECGVEGKAWADTEAPYDRLPARAKSKVRDVIWNLSRASAGMACRFLTDAARVYARWTLGKEALGMWHFPPSGVSGLDLYAQDFDGRWRWAGTARDIEFPTSERLLVDRMEPQHRPFMLYLPLYNSVARLEIGLPASASFEPLPPRDAPPVVFYGTSIVQGASASRPGMSHLAILGRRLDRPVVNLGFSGNAHMEPEIAELLGELDPAVYVLDPVPNMGVDLIDQRAERFVRILRNARPHTPIVLVEDRTYGNAWIHKANRDSNIARRAAFRAAYERLLDQNVQGLTYLAGDMLLGADGEATVDSSHPTDLGFMRMADYLEPELREILDAPQAATD